MKPSPMDDVRKMYDETADSYAKMMDAEIDLPVYTDVLGRLQERIANLQGPMVDTACGSGHMLSMYRERYDQERAFIGIDLSPQMVAIAKEKLDAGARMIVGDMRSLADVDSGSCAAVLNFFALHHLDAKGAAQALGEWFRALVPGGQLVAAAWEGSGTVDYGDEADLVAFRYTSAELDSWARSAGFSVTRCHVEPVEDFPMDAVYLEASKPAS